MGGRAQKTYPPTLAAWAYISHRDDPHHLAFNSFYGADWSKYYGTRLREFDYLASAAFFGGKKWSQDIFSFDIYPIAGRLHPSLNFPDMGPYAAYYDALDRARINNKNLIPLMPTINPSNRNPTETLLIHSDEQVYSEAWLNVIHGAKGIIWFPYFAPPSIRWNAMKKFAEQMKVLAQVVLQPEPTRAVTDNANAPLNRVDTMIREKGGVIYIFAARVTEPDPIPNAKYQGVEPDSIQIQFLISDIRRDLMVEVMDEGRTIPLAKGIFIDTFRKNEVHIYKVSSKDISPILNNLLLSLD
jgi:hypothetical protein